MYTQPQNRRSHPRLQKVASWIKKHSFVLALTIGPAIVAGVFLWALWTIQPAQLNDATYTVKKQAEKYYSPLTGVEVADEAATKRPVTAVMIENSPDARPQSGLKDAGIVYEAVAEGGITRFIALYQEAKPELIGPVRSLRMYYLDWAAPYQASIAHVGGSPNALAEVRGGSYRDIDQFFNAGSYWRASDRYAPHNVYTNFERLDQLNASKGYKESTFQGFSRQEAKPAEEKNATSMTVNFSSALFNTSYTYNAETNTYARSIAGVAHNDREKGQISPSSVVVLKVGTQSRGGADSYEDLATTGTGQAYVFQNGTVQEVTWKKDGRTSPLQLTSASGEAIKLNRGQTWIGAITGSGSVSWQ